MLESKLRNGTFKTKKMQICLDEVALFWMSQWTACSPAWRILYHVTASCKGTIGQSHNQENVLFQSPSCCPRSGFDSPLLAEYVRSHVYSWRECDSNLIILILTRPRQTCLILFTCTSGEIEYSTSTSRSSTRGEWK